MLFNRDYCWSLSKEITFTLPSSQSNAATVYTGEVEKFVIVSCSFLKMLCTNIYIGWFFLPSYTKYVFFHNDSRHRCSKQVVFTIVCVRANVSKCYIPVTVMFTLRCNTSLVIWLYRAVSINDKNVATSDKWTPTFTPAQTYAVPSNLIKTWRLRLCDSACPLDRAPFYR